MTRHPRGTVLGAVVAVGFVAAIALSSHARWMIAIPILFYIGLVALSSD